MGSEDIRPTQISESLPFPTQSDEIWKMLLDRSKTPEGLAHTMSGEMWVCEKDGEEETCRWTQVYRPLINKNGINRIMPIMMSSMLPDKIATALTSEEVNSMTLEMSRALIFIVAEYGDEFEIDAGFRSLLVLLLEQSYFSNLTASRRGTILNALKYGYTREEKYGEQPRQNRNFPMPRLLG